MDTSSTMSGLGLIGTGLKVGGTIGQGAAAKKAGEFEARQYEMYAPIKRAEGQRAGMAEAERGNIVRGQQQAIAAASGGGVATPTISAIMGETAARAQYGQNVKQWEGDVASTQLLNTAAARRTYGQNAYTGSILQGIGEGLEGVSKFGSKSGLFAKKMPTLDDDSGWNTTVTRG